MEEQQKIHIIDDLEKSLAKYRKTNKEASILLHEAADALEKGYTDVVMDHISRVLDMMKNLEE